MKYSINDIHLTNGFKIIYAKDNTAPIVSIQLFVRMGSAFEGDNEKGYSHFIEHLAFKSTAKFPDNTLMEKAAEYGAMINAYTEY